MSVAVAGVGVVRDVAVQSPNKPEILTLSCQTTNGGGGDASAQLIDQRLDEVIKQSSHHLISVCPGIVLYIGIHPILYHSIAIYTKLSRNQVQL